MKASPYKLSFEEQFLMPPINGSSLPPSLAPRGLSRVQAAEYIGVGVSKFDEMVGDGRMPKPKRVDARTIWDRWQIDAAFTALDGARGDENPTHKRLGIP
jgi:predicted DNA-binding transcriptional regulator AlpA